MVPALRAFVEELPREQLPELKGLLEARLWREALTVNPAPDPAPVEPGDPLEIGDVAKLTGYSESRLRHMGDTLPGYKKWPSGKVTWFKNLLVHGMKQGKK
jgi:hypothetical protein